VQPLSLEVWTELPFATQPWWRELASGYIYLSFFLLLWSAMEWMEARMADAKGARKRDSAASTSFRSAAAPKQTTKLQ